MMTTQKTNKKQFVALLILLGLASAQAFEAKGLAAAGGWVRAEPVVNDGSWVGTVDPQANANTPTGPFALLLDQPSILISRPEYTLSWNPSTRIVNWASWVLVNGNVGRTNRSGFKRDEDLNQFLLAQGDTAVAPDEYNDKHCFDRGHVVPSADRTEKFAQNQAVFKMSNMMPQTAFLNRVIWERLEGSTRSLLAKNPKNRYWVVAGPIFTAKMRYMGVNKNIAIPDSNFKIVIDLGSSKDSVPKLIASVIMPNLTSKGTDPIEDEAFECFEERNLPSMNVDWADYTVSIDEIEKAAGIDLTALKGIVF